MPDESSKWRETLDDVLAPLRAQRDTVENAIAEKEQELKELRNVRSEIVRVLSAAEPKKTRAKRKPGETVLQSVSAAKLDALTEYVRNAFDSEAFSGPEIMKRGDFDLMSEPTLRSALENLSARGVIRLDSVGGPKAARRKNYKVVRGSK